MHWLEEQRPQARDAAIAELRLMYPDAPASPPEGARDLDSTYLHLIVCHLEYEIMKTLVGETRARATLERSGQIYYRWVFRTVLQEHARIEAVARKHGLTP